MYRGIQTQRSCARAWVAACNKIMKTGDEGYNIVIDVADPVTLDDKDHEAITLVDKFLKLYDKYPIITVANTIFPQSLFDAHGPTEFYKIYHRDFDALSVDSRRWGRYFERMTRHQTKDGEEYNPLQSMIEKMKVRDGSYKAAYELAVYDPLLDGRMFRGGQCLSFLSFKIHPENGLLLTAMYRNHTYITRCLGNLIGLGRLQKFIAKQAGLKLGSLTVISTHAELDTEGWGIKDARELVIQSEEILRRQ
jgi:thymidylate synthase